MKYILLAGLLVSLLAAGLEGSPALAQNNVPKKTWEAKEQPSKLKPLNLRGMLKKPKSVDRSPGQQAPMSRNTREMLTEGRDLPQNNPFKSDSVDFNPQRYRQRMSRPFMNSTQSEAEAYLAQAKKREQQNIREMSEKRAAFYRRRGLSPNMPASAQQRRRQNVRQTSLNRQTRSERNQGSNGAQSQNAPKPIVMPKTPKNDTPRRVFPFFY